MVRRQGDTETKIKGTITNGRGGDNRLSKTGPNGPVFFCAFGC